MRTIEAVGASDHACARPLNVCCTHPVRRKAVMSKGDAGKADEAQDGPVADPAAALVPPEQAAAAKEAPNAQLVPPASVPQVSS